MSTTQFRPIECPLLRQPALPRTRFREVAERIGGGVLLAVASPAIALSAATVSILSGRSPFIAHLRVGQYGQAFWTLKLRTMWQPMDPTLGEPGWLDYVAEDPADQGKLNDDPRVTSRIAAFFRRHSIDELPQLWHVARGQMSLIGPRPLTRSEVVRHYGPQASELLSVKPGLTGLWQVYGRSAIRFPQRAAMDLALVRGLTPLMYWKILLRTIPALIVGKGAW